MKIKTSKVAIRSINKDFLRKRTFWDADFDTLDSLKDRDFLIARVVQRGSDREVDYINELVGYSGIYEVLKSYEGVNKITFEFYKNMSNG